MFYETKVAQLVLVTCICPDNPFQLFLSALISCLSHDSLALCTGKMKLAYDEKSPKLQPPSPHRYLRWSHVPLVRHRTRGLYCRTIPRIPRLTTETNRGTEYAAPNSPRVRWNTTSSGLGRVCRKTGPCKINHGGEINEHLDSNGYGMLPM